MRIRFVIGSLIALVAVAPSQGETPLTTAFTYQGQLKDGGMPATGAYDLQFRLFDAANSGNHVAGTQASGRLYHYSQLRENDPPGFTFRHTGV